MRGLRSSAVVALALLLGAPAAQAASDAPGPARVVALGADLEDLAPDGRGVQTILAQRTRADTNLVRDRVAMAGLEPPLPLLDLTPDNEVLGAALLPGGGALTAYVTRGDGYVGNELRAVVGTAGSRSEQRLNAPNTQGGSLAASFAVGPTGTLAVSFGQDPVPYRVERVSSDDPVIAVRPAGAAAFTDAQPIFPHGTQGFDGFTARTFLGPDGGGWIFLLPNSDNWRAGQPVVVLARRIQPDGRLGVLLHLPVPITRPSNTSALVSAGFDGAGRLLAAFSATGYYHRDRERAVVWTQTFTAATTTVPRRSMIVDRQGGYEQIDNIDLHLDARGRAAVIAQTRGGVRVFVRHGTDWSPGPKVTATRRTFTARLVRLSDGRTAAVWLQPYNASGNRSNLMVAAGRLTDPRWVAHRVPGLGRPGVQGLSAVAALDDDGIAAAIYQRDERIAFTRIGG